MHNTEATTEEKRTSRGRNLEVKPKETKDSQSRVSSIIRSTYTPCTCTLPVCIILCQHSGCVNHAPTLLPVYNCEPFAERGHSPHSTKTHGVSSYTSRQTDTLHGKLEGLFLQKLPDYVLKYPARIKSRLEASGQLQHFLSLKDVRSCEANTAATELYSTYLRMIKSTILVQPQLSTSTPFLRLILSYRS